jgi:hypothetical protein
MGSRRAPLAWLIFTLTVTSLIVAAFLPDEDWPLITLVCFAVAMTIISALGAAIVTRRGDHAIGWILMSLALLVGLGSLATQYANRTLVDAPGSLPGGVVAAWLQSWLWAPIGGGLALLLLLFPTGRPPSPRWRPVAWLCTVFIVGPTVLYAVRPGPLETFPSVENPIGIPALGSVDAILGGGFFGLVLTVLVTVVSLVVRFRRSRESERQQLKVFLFAVFAAIVLVSLNPIFFTFVFDPDLEGSSLTMLFGFGMPLLALTLLPLGITLAILRYRLFDIDRLVSRTVSYAIITAVLGALYLSFVVGLQRLFVTTSNDLLIAMSTLVVVAASVPVRRRVQRVVDQRFNRRRYNAERTVAAFAGRLRQQIDLDSLDAQLRAVVNETMQPDGVSLWLRS